MRASDFDLLIAPRPGDASADWPERWRAKLSTARFVAPEPQLAPWAAAVAEAARTARRPVLFIGHGCGAAAVIEAAQAAHGADVRGAFLVAPPDEAGLERRIGARWTAPRARLPWPSLVVASRNDPDAEFDPLAALASDWGAELVDAGFAGSLDAASGHGPWPEGLMRLAGFIKRMGEKPDAVSRETRH